MLSTRIMNILKGNGLGNLPTDSKASLAEGGLDSLMLALLIIELEREFHVKIPVIPLAKERFESIDSIENYLMELGAQ